MNISRGTVKTTGSAGGGASDPFGAAFPANGAAAGASNPGGNLAPLKVDGSGNLLVAVTGAGSGGTSSVDQAGYTAATTAGTPVMAAVDEAATTDAVEGQVGIVRMTPGRALRVAMTSDSGVSLGYPTAPIYVAPSDAGITENQLDYNTAGPVDLQSIIGIALPTASGAVAGGTSTNPLRTDPTGTTTQPVSIATAPALVASSAVIGHVIVDTAPTTAVTIATAPVLVAGAAVIGKVGIDQTTPGTTNGVQVNAALPAGANAIGKLAANAGVTIGAVELAAAQTLATVTAVTTVATVTALTGGGVAHDGADSGNPHKLGGRADTTFQTAVADGDRVDALFDVYGQLRTRSDHANNWSYHKDGSSALTDDSVQAAPGSGLSIYVTDIVVSNGAATAMNVFFEEGATKVLGPYYLEAVAGRGLVISFKTPKKITANTALTVTTSAAIAHSLDITGFIAP